jgi:hypothetical protein
MSDRRTRDQLRASNEKLRAAIRRYVKAIENPPEQLAGIERQHAWLALKELMGEEA